MTPVLSATTMERLAFIRWVYRLGVEQSTYPEPMNAIAVLLFHDSADLLLQLAGEHVNAPEHTSNPNRTPAFMEHFAPINAQLGSRGPLGQQSAMRRLNGARNLLKHHGTRPSHRDVEGFRISADTFFEGAVPLVFGIAFDEISMARLVTVAEARAHLEEAEKLAASDDREGSIAASATAFAYLLHAHRIEEPGTSRFGMFPSSLRSSDNFDVRDLGAVVESLQEAVESLQEQVGILSLGAEPGDMKRFLALTPHVRIAMAGNPRTTSRPHQEPPTTDDVRFCCEFVIAAALVVQRRFGVK